MTEEGPTSLVAATTEDQQAGSTTRPVPKWLPILGTLLVLVGVFGRNSIVGLFTEEQLNKTALLSGIPFLMVFAGIILLFMAFVWWLAYRFNDRVSAKTYRIIEYAWIGGIVLGAIMMFQPWVFELFRYGFYLLLLSTLGFTAWSHVTPADAIALVAPADSAA